MKVKSKLNLIYKGEIYNAGAVFDMDEVSFAIAKKYGKIEAVEGSVEVTENVVELPPLEVKKKK